ncbi:response regulator [Chitinophaga pinensis]|uniref:Response regulator receiver protein n=1 Tax=Chitinophaga pinensis (strain ATCC 43595 / DSM 2588 / LMG 13176 / NBRC 15968 / NCIMB 11800 / UQM 2034) TaxID=485918 RepID=A0A979FZ65_CHIPD|nr:response regulator [Chitinophaga pinensis]ACU57825.1 response regulator receiver protein [Chitinophaga pinensis DSM 2588]
MQLSGHSKRLILLAEDDIDDQELLENAIEEIDPTWQLVCIPNGRKFVKYLDTMGESNMPALMILDYNIPELTGVEVVKELNDQGRFMDIPKIIWSTSTSPVFKAKSIELGVKDYITKPNDLASFLTTARYMLSFVKE